jgi:hypothetical protein
VCSITEADTTVIKYINKKVTELDSERNSLIERIDHAKRTQEQTHKKDKRITNAMDKWDSLSFDEKRGVIELMVDRINMYVDTMEIIWNC